MPDELVSKILDVVAHSPPHVNPYDTVIEVLKKHLEPPPTPRWLSNLRILTLVLYVLMFFQAVSLLYQRYRTSPLFKLRRNNLGLVFVDIYYNTGLVYFFFAPVTAYILIIQIAAERGHHAKESTILFIFCHKFFALILGSWGMFDFASTMNRERLQTLIKWAYSSFFVFVALVPLPFITWPYVNAYRDLREEESIIEDLITALRQQASAYDPKKFYLDNILSQLGPAIKLNMLRISLGMNLRYGLIVYSLDNCLLILIHTPLLWISLRSLYKKSPPPASLSRSVCICWHCTAFATLDFPSYSQHGRLRVRSTRRETYYHGLTDPMAFLGNIILLALNLNSYRNLRARNKSGRQSIPTPTGGANFKNQQQEIHLEDMNVTTERISIALHDIPIVLDNSEDIAQYSEKSAWWDGSAPGHSDRN
ncbi:hypothetical protein PCASD_22479 [Puccinia coronata f. sp. avenae]|uniref:Uncharacterized protein n=1 Tax=Puccinia coronata f. sp. avenae TaxID=200324 RepID=A0A2N5S6F1_9BASI|nr:hypothetical protein PCASD_22479 [Puccinia coronata f. sp. avenae]